MRTDFLGVFMDFAITLPAKSIKTKRIMKRNLLTMAALMMISGNVIAKDVISLKEISSPIGKPRPNATKTPEVSYEDGTIELRSDSAIECATISIKDIYNNVIHETVENIGNAPKQISLPDDVDEEKATIEIITDEKAFKGEF